MAHEKFSSFNWFPRDWLVGTVRLTAEQKGMFADLLSYAWDQTPPCTIPDEETIIAKWAGVSVARFRKAGGPVLAKFAPIGEGLRRNNKQWTIYQSAVEYRIRRRKAGKKGANERWQSDSNAIAMPLLPLPSPPIPIPIPITEKKEKVKKEKRGTTLPADWLPNETHNAVAIRFPGVQVSVEVENFRDHHTAKGSVFKDWDAAFRTWLRNAAKFAANRSQTGKVNEKPQSTGSRSEGWSTVGGQRLESEEERDDKRVTQWRTENPDKAQALWQECVNEIAEMFTGNRGQFTEVAARAMVSSKFRARVIAEHLTPRLSA